MVLHHLQFIFVYVGKCKANFVFTMCAICNTLTIRGQFWKNLIIRDDIMNIMKNAVKMRYQNSPGMWRKHTPIALDKWYDKLESDCDIQFVVFFVLLTYLLQNWYSLTHLWRVPSHMPGWWRPVLFYPRLKKWEKESIIKWQIEKTRERKHKHYILRRGKNAESGVYDSYYVTSLDKRSRAIVEMTS